MKPTGNPYFDAAQRSAEKQIAMEQQADPRQAPPPFGEERLNARDGRARLAAMSPQERAAFLQEHGIDAVMKLIQGKP